MNKEFERLVDLKTLGLHERELAEFECDPIKWFNHEEDPHKTILRIMRQPEHFHFTCKHLLNVDLMMFQQVILQELWKHAFPMLAGSRGLGKCVTGDTWVTTKDGFKQIADIVGDWPAGRRKYATNLHLWGENGFNEVEYSYCNGYGPTKKLRTRLGYSLEATPNHPLRVVRDNRLEWVNAEDIRVGDKVPINRDAEWFPEVNDLDVDSAYALGALVGDGCLTQPTCLIFSTAEPDHFIPRLNKLFSKDFAKVPSALCDWRLYSRQSYRELYSRFGFVGTNSGDKDVPRSVLGASKEAVAAFIRGYADTDGYADKALARVEIVSKSPKLIKTLQMLLLRFGIICKRSRRWNAEYQRYYYCASMFGDNARLYSREIGFALDRKQAILTEMCRSTSNTNLDVLPHDLILEDALQVRDEWRLHRNDHPELKKGFKRSRCKFFTPSKLKAYELSYDKFGEYLDQNSHLDSEAWRRLDEINSAHLFYDTIQSIEDGEAVTYDVHMVSDEDRSFIGNGFVNHNSFLLALYSVLRCIIYPGTKVVITGMGFRQAKQVLNYAFGFWNRSPVLQSLYGDSPQSGPKYGNDRYVLRLGESTITGLPMGDGTSIRGERANVVIGDEFASITRDIFETVVAGFGVVSLSPIEQVRNKARIEVMKDLRLWSEEMAEQERTTGIGNQLIISGTCYYQFNHFYSYWKRYKQIIESRGDREKLRQAFEGEEVPEGLDHRKYAIIRMPIDLLPPGYMDQDQIDRSKVTMHSGTFNNEFKAVFSADSNGFFKRSMIERCVTKEAIVPHGASEGVRFQAVLRGTPGCQYVYGVDPASENDKLAIVILEVHATHRRIVYCWTTNKTEYKSREQKKLTDAADFYGFIARKIRDLMKVFPPIAIALDSQGGGVSVLEALGAKDRLRDDEQPLYIVDGGPLHDGKQRESDVKSGLHIVEWVNFANSAYTSEANHGMRKDFEYQQLLFPYYDTAVLAVAGAEDEMAGRIYDTQEDVVREIEDLKDELATITHTQTPGTLRDHWDTPEIKLANSKKGRMRKDRYSSLLMANYAARRINRQETPPELQPYGGFITHNYGTAVDRTVATGPDWWTREVTQGLEGFGAV